MRYNHKLKMNDLFPERQAGGCRFCGKKLNGRQRKWCSKKCSMKAFDELMFAKGSGSHIRAAVYQRDGGICAICNLDCNLIERISTHATSSLENYIIEKLPLEDFQPKFTGKQFIIPADEELKAFLRFARKLWRKTPISFGRSGWEADHILEVVNGGTHHLDNLQTLCVPCHKQKTKNLIKNFNFRQA